MNKRRRLFFVLGSVAFYMLAFVLTWPFEGDIAGLWTILPAVSIGWFIGMPAALVFGLLSVPFNLLLFGFVGSQVANLPVYHLTGGLAYTSIAIATAWTKRVVDQSKEQALQLERERRVLQEEITKRKQVEQALQSVKNNLEIVVTERTNELTHAVDQLRVELVERKQAEEKTLRMNKGLATLNQIGQALGKLAQPSEILALIDEMIGQVFDNRNLCIGLYDEASRYISFPIYRVEGKDSVSKTGRLFSNGLTEFLIRTKAPLLISDHVEETLAERGIPFHGPMMRSLLAVPILINDRGIGMIGIHDYEKVNVYDAEDLELLSIIASQAAIALENARLFTEVQLELAEREKAEKRLVHSALHDPLTDLPNRALFMDRLNQAMERAQRRKEYRFAVLYLDLDRFKVVNDSLGHNIGDLLLIESARRLASCLRTLDTVARLGGDEFVILLEDIQDLSEGTRIADRIQHDLALPCDLNHHTVFVSVSIGVVLTTNEYERPEDILRDADTAMYSAKALGRGRYEVFDRTMRDRAMTRLDLETDLRMALQRQEFVINYQPIVSLQTQGLVGFEALVRWQHPTRGLVAPAEFIPAAEETGLIIPIDQWVLREACIQMRDWQERFPADPPLTVSVNLSAKHFALPDLAQQIAQVLQETGLDARSLKLELTESMIVEDSEAVSSVLSELGALGVQVQIDDFGTGYSSLGYLHRLPIDTLKIDRTFISKLGMNGNGSEIVRTILVLAHDLGMKVIAEGVETLDQLARLQGLECEYGQGFLFAKPVDYKKAGALITELRVAV